MTRQQFKAQHLAAHYAFHERWSAAVGQPGYVKAEWMALSNALDREWRDRATAIGIPKTEALLP